MDPFVSMYYLKRAILVYQFMFGSYPNLSDIPMVSIDDKESFCYAVSDAIDAINYKIITAAYTPELQAFCNEHSCPDVLTVVESCDFEVITDKHHHRKFFNEIENDSIISYFIDEFERVWEIDEDGQYFVSVYDWNDHDIFFSDMDDLNSFVNNYDIAPYTVFEMVNGAAVEMYSE